MSETARSVDGRGTTGVRTRALTRRFGALLAVDSLDLTVAAGCIFGLLGPNGAGKTTTVRMLTTLLPPTSGSATVAGHDVVREPAEVRRRIGYVPQLLSADGGLTGYENLLLSARLYDIPRAGRDARIREALEFMGLGEVADRVVQTYSGGMIRRLELAQSMLHHPAVLFLDEPTIGLDPHARHLVWDRLRESRRRFDLTVLLTTHDMEEAERLCDTVAIMHGGRVAAVGAPADLKRAVGPEATMDEVFEHFAGAGLEEGGSYRDTRSIRSTADRVG